MTAAAALRLRDLARAEIYRKTLEWKRRWVLWLVGSLIIYAFGLAAQRNLFGAGQPATAALSAMAAWLGFLAMSASVAAELGRSRRNATIALVLSRNTNVSVLRNIFALTLGEVALFVPALILLWVCGCLFALSWIDPLRLAQAGVLGLFTGGVLGPTVWALALFLRKETVLAAVLGVGFFIWVGIANAANASLPLRAIYAVSPLRLLDPAGPVSVLIWISFWGAVGLLSFLLGRVILQLIREGGDLISDD